MTLHSLILHVLSKNKDILVHNLNDIITLKEINIHFSVSSEYTVYLMYALFLGQLLKFSLLYIQ